jgi:hypothetical protein
MDIEIDADQFFILMQDLSVLKAEREKFQALLTEAVDIISGHAITTNRWKEDFIGRARQALEEKAK